MDDPERDKKKGIQKKGEPVKEDEDKKKAGSVQTKTRGERNSSIPRFLHELKTPLGRELYCLPKHFMK